MKSGLYRPICNIMLQIILPGSHLIINGNCKNCYIWCKYHCILITPVDMLDIN